MSMPPGPDPREGLFQKRIDEISEMLRNEGNNISGLMGYFPITLDERRELLDVLEKLATRGKGEGAISNKHLNQLLEPLATPLSEARREGQAETRLTLQGQRILYTARILAFDIWDHDGHASSAILTDLVEMWTLRENGDMAKGRRRRWEMAKLLWIALRQRSGTDSFTIEDISKLPYDSHRRVAANPRLSQVLMEMGVAAVHENPDHLNMDWFGPPRYHWWSTDDPASIGKQLEKNVLEGIYRLLVSSLGIRAIEKIDNENAKALLFSDVGNVRVSPMVESEIVLEETEDSRTVLHGTQNVLDLSTLWCPFGKQEQWADGFVITYDGSRSAFGFDLLALNWRGSNVTKTIQPPTIVELESKVRALRIITPIPTRTDIIGPAPVF